MNKLDGFFELKTLGIPSVPWERYTGAQTLDNAKLWTVRVALAKGGDFNLPRKVGVMTAEAVEFANGLLKTLGKDDYIIYYPYFIAEKSGTLEVSYDRTVIEAVDKDLWNLVTHNRRDVTVIEENGKIDYYGNREFLAPNEVSELLKYGGYIRRRYRSDYMMRGALLLEWSYACESNPDGTPKGLKKLIFIEIRETKR